ncbi:MAG TPA: PAS domain S-box protein, partial [Caldithrix sp.]|nr:PAS domain S-box protein [Caldithrix sp.]
MNSKKNHRKPDFRKDDIFIDNERVLKNMLDGFIVVEHDGKIIKVNPAYCEMTGYTKSE